jgi:cardiolipin synthase
MNLDHILLITSFVLNLLAILTIIFYERRKPINAIAWIFILSFTSYIGFIFYLFFGMSFRKKRIVKQKFRTKSFKKLTMLKELSDKLKISEETLEFITFLEANSYSSFYLNNNLDIYIEGKKFFAELIDKIKNAKSYIHMEYYIFRDDNISKCILKELEEKAKQGVEVVLILDGFGSRKFKPKFFKKLKENGGKVYTFFPLFIPFLNLRANYRNHRKICIVDGEYAYMGGFNVGDEYLKNWRDTHIRIEGDAIYDIQLEFLLDYEFVSNKRQNREKYFKIKKEYLDLPMQIVGSGPNYSLPIMKNSLLKMISLAKKSVLIQTPYFIPDDALLDMLKLHLMSGKEVIIMIPNKPDHLFVYWATYSYIGELLEYGAKCYIYQKGFLHSKVMIIDDEIATIGSTNVDMRSFYLNFEINAFIYDFKKIHELKTIYYKDIKNSKKLTLEEYNKRSKVIKIKESVSRLLSPVL